MALDGPSFPWEKCIKLPKAWSKQAFFFVGGDELMGQNARLI